MQINAFAKNLEHPCWLYVLPNGDVLVAETNAPFGMSLVGDNLYIANWVVDDVGNTLWRVSKN